MAIWTVASNSTTNCTAGSGGAAACQFNAGGSASTLSIAPAHGPARPLRPRVATQSVLRPLAAPALLAAPNNRWLPPWQHQQARPRPSALWQVLPSHQQRAQPLMASPHRPPPAAAASSVAAAGAAAAASMAAATQQQQQQAPAPAGTMSKLWDSSRCELIQSSLPAGAKKGRRRQQGSLPLGEPPSPCAPRVLQDVCGGRSSRRSGAHSHRSP